MQQNNLFSDTLKAVTRYLKILVVVVIVGIFLSGVRMVKTGNVALVLRCGKLVGDTYEEQVHESGLLFAFPYIIDEVITVPVNSVMEQSVTTHYSEGIYTKNGAYVITGDQNIAQMSASVKYMVSDPVAYALNVKDIKSILNASVSNAMLSEAASYDVDLLLTTEKDNFSAQTKTRTQEKLNAAKVGVTITSIELTQVTMPTEVRAAYNNVNSATVEAATLLETAKTQSNVQLKEAEGFAAEKVANAKANQAAKVSAANANLSEFHGLLEEYKQSPDVVRIRVYSAKVRTMLDKIKTVRVVADDESKIFLNP